MDSHPLKKNKTICYTQTSLQRWFHIHLPTEGAIQASSPTGDKSPFRDPLVGKTNSATRCLHDVIVDWGLSIKPPDLVFALFTTGVKQISSLLSVISMRNKQKIKQREEVAQDRKLPGLATI